jgi:5'-AMP-activated protein kinase beta subunit, interaction domain
MKLSKYMPTAVDFTNFLVNYIEVGPEDIQTPPPDVENIQLDGKAPLETDFTQPKPIGRATAGTRVPEALPPTPQEAPVTQEQKDAAAKAAEEPKDILAEQLIKGKSLVPTSPKSYHTKIPQFLIDLDANEESAKFARVNALVNTIPAPPSLPMFLAKSILNGNPPMRDDASVLILPNHTVLNHLATSSIRNGVLATSGTTRYKQKVCINFASCLLSLTI